MSKRAELLHLSGRDIDPSYPSAFVENIKLKGTPIQKAVITFIEDFDPEGLVSLDMAGSQSVQEEEDHVFDHEDYEYYFNPDGTRKKQPLEQIIKSVIARSEQPEDTKYEIAQVMRALWYENEVIYMLQTQDVSDIREADTSLAGTRYWIMEELLQHDIFSRWDHVQATEPPTIIFTTKPLQKQ